MEYTNYFAVDVAPWGDFGIDTVPKSKKCKVNGWTQLAKSVDVDFLPALMEPAPVKSPNKANKLNYSLSSVASIFCGLPSSSSCTLTPCKQRLIPA